jgi:hypothetical protein
MAAAVGLQAADLSGVYALKRAGHSVQISDPLPSPFWDIVPRFYRHVVLYPPNTCAPVDQGLDYRFFAIHAAEAGATINGGYAARFDAVAVREYCRTLEQEMQQGSVADDTLYVFGVGHETRLRSSPTPVTCGPVDNHVVCATTASAERWIGQLPSGVWP